MLAIGLQGAKPLDWGAGHISAAFPLLYAAGRRHLLNEN